MDTPTTISEYQDTALELCERLDNCNNPATARGILKRLKELSEDSSDLSHGLNLAVLHADSKCRALENRIAGRDAAVIEIEKQDRENMKRAPKWLNWD